jgi:hypothetical protein
MLTDFDQQIIPIYSPISARGGRRTRTGGIRSKKLKTRRHKKSNSNSNSKNRRSRRYR